MIAFAFLFADPAEGVLPQSVIAATLVAMLVTSLLVIRFLDHPYSKGAGGLKPTDMTRVLGQINQAGRVLGVHMPIPCDAAGHPL